MTIPQGRSTLAALLALTTALVASGCGDSSTEVNDVASVSVRPNAASLYIAGTQQLTAALLDASGGTLRGRQVAWSTSNAAVADVSETGHVAAGVPGTATITATSEGRQGTATITVRPCDGGAALSVGQTVNGTLAPGDEFIGGDFPYVDPFALTVDQSGAVRITMRSVQLNADLWLLPIGSTGVLAHDDDSGGGVNGQDAQIVTSLGRGCYRVWATSFGIETGSYSLTVTSP